MSKNVTLAIAAIVLFIGWDSFYVVQEYEQGIVTRLGEFKYSFRTPGLTLKRPLVDSVTIMPKKVLGSDTPPAEYLTLDKKKLLADPISRWRIVDPIKFYTKVKDEFGAKARLDDIVNSELRAQIANRNFGEIIGNRREDLVQQVATKARPQLEPFGILLLDVRIKRADLPQAVQESVFQRMRAERDRMARKYKAEGNEEAKVIRSATDKEREILLAQAYEKAQVLRGEGDAESIAVYAAAYEKDTEFYAFTRSLQAYEKLIDPGSKVVLSTSNELLSYFGDSK